MYDLINMLIGGTFLVFVAATLVMAIGASALVVFGQFKHTRKK